MGYTLTLENPCSNLVLSGWAVREFIIHTYDRINRQYKPRYRVALLRNGGVLIEEFPVRNGKTLGYRTLPKGYLYIAPLELKNGEWKRKIGILPKYVQKELQKILLW